MQPDCLVGQVVVIIPARNEEASLPLVLSDLPPVGHVIVVNNGSTDNTAEVARRCGALVIDEPRPGYGRACLAGMAAIRRLIDAGSMTPPEIIAFVDGDYSDSPELLPVLAAPILAGEADFVLGSRLLGAREPGAMPPQSLLGNRFACCLMKLLWGGDYTDLGPFRLIRYQQLLKLSMQDTNFGWTIEMQIKALAAALRVLEMPVPYRRRIGQSKISGTLSGSIKAGVKILFTVARYSVNPKKAELRGLRQG